MYLSVLASLSKLAYSISGLCGSDIMIIEAWYRIGYRGCRDGAVTRDRIASNSLSSIP